MLHTWKNKWKKLIHIIYHNFQKESSSNKCTKIKKNNLHIAPSDQGCCLYLQSVIQSSIFVELFW